MEEKTVKGIILEWNPSCEGKDENKDKFYTSCNIKGEWYMFIADSKEQLDKLFKQAPPQTEVEFVQEREGDVGLFIYKQKSMKVLGKATTKQDVKKEMKKSLEPITEETVSDNKEESKAEATEPPETKEKPKIKQKQAPGNYFKVLNMVKADVAKKGNLNYISWANAWEMLKRNHPDAHYEVYTNGDGLPYFADKTGVYCHVGVTVNNIEHDVWLPVMGLKNDSIMWKDVSSMQINKTIQRALAKAIAMHGLGLYVFRGEDIPTDQGESTHFEEGEETDLY